MTVGLRVGSFVDEIGTQAFLHSFFSTISYHLEENGWGSRFPELMIDLYNGSLDSTKAEKALAEFEVIRSELSRHSPEKVVWDIDNPAAEPPWGEHQSGHHRPVQLLCDQHRERSL